MRAERRHHRERMKRKAAKLYPGQEPGRFADNLTPCSCWMCGNPRRHRGKGTEAEGRSRQELVAALIDDD